MDPSSTSSVLELAGKADLQTRAEMETETETDASKVAEHQGYAEALSLFARSSNRRSNRRSCSTSKILSASAIFFALMLVVGAIFMHLRHKHHLGRLHTHLRDHAEHLPLVAAAGVGELAQGPLFTCSIAESSSLTDNFISGLHCGALFLSLSVSSPVD